LECEDSQALIKATIELRDPDTDSLPSDDEEGTYIPNQWEYIEAEMLDEVLNVSGIQFSNLWEGCQVKNILDFLYIAKLHAVYIYNSLSQPIQLHYPGSESGGSLGPDGVTAETIPVVVARLKVLHMYLESHSPSVLIPVTLGKQAGIQTAYLLTSILHLFVTASYEVYYERNYQFIYDDVMFALTQHGVIVDTSNNGRGKMEPGIPPYVGFPTGWVLIQAKQVILRQVA
jgi:hypothetical protein